jgi:hypothetical protein
MNRKHIIAMILFLAVIITSSCTGNNSESYKEDIEELTNKNTTLLEENCDLTKLLEEREVELAELQTELEETKKLLERKQIEMFPPSICYVYFEEVGSYVFIDHQTNIRMLPYDNAQNIRVVFENSLVKVLDKAQVQTLEEYENDKYWYYVEVRAYDTPLNTKGWIRLEETLPYTEDNQSKVTGPVKIKDGVEICEEDPFVDGYSECTLSSDEVGRIIGFKDGYVWIMAAGGEDFWTKEENIIYPEIKKQIEE